MTRKSIIALSIYEDIKNNIDLEIFSRGDTLPSEVALCTKYKASRVSIRAALNQLKREHIVHSQAGKGWIVGAASEAELKLSKAKEMAKKNKSEPIEITPTLNGEVLFISKNHHVSTLLYHGLSNGLRAVGLSVRMIIGVNFQKNYDALFQQNEEAFKSAKAVVIFNDNKLNDPLISCFQAFSLPVIIVGQARQTPFDTVTCDVRNAISDLIIHLAEVGHKNIAFVKNSEQSHISSFFDREQGYLDGIKLAGLKPLIVSYGWKDMSSLELQETFANTFKSTGKTDKAVTAIIFSAVQQTREVSAILQVQGIDLKNIEFYGVGNRHLHLNEGIQQEYWTNIINENWDEIGLTCAKILQRRLLGNDHSPPSLTLIKSEIITNHLKEN